MHWPKSETNFNIQIESISNSLFFFQIWANMSTQKMTNTCLFCDKLEVHGVTGSVLTWLKFHLQNRLLCASVDGIISNLKEFFYV